jgi:hypothetical protein
MIQGYTRNHTRLYDKVERMNNEILIKCRDISIQSSIGATFGWNQMFLSGLMLQKLEEFMEAGMNQTETEPSYSEFLLQNILLTTLSCY